jgi:hypothetical protein
MVDIDRQDFGEVLEIQQNKENRNSNREKYRKRVEQAYEVLIETAQNEGTIFYSDLWTQIGTGRQYIGPVVGGVSRLELRQDRPPLSAIAVRKEDGMPGRGLWENLLADHGLWEPGEDRERVWQEQVDRVYDKWG